MRGTSLFSRVSMSTAPSLRCPPVATIVSGRRFPSTRGGSSWSARRGNVGSHALSARTRRSRISCHLMEAPCVPLRAGGIGAALLSTVDRGTCAYGAVHSPGPVCHGNELGQHVNLYAVTGVGVVALPHGLSRAELLRQVPERNPGPVPAVDTVDDASIVLKRAVPYSSHSKAAVAQREPTAHPSTPQTVLLITYSPSLRRASPHIKERRPRPPRARSRPTPRPRRPTVCPVRPP